MYDVIDRLRGKELADNCYVARSARMENSSFEDTINHFSTLGEKRERPKDVDIESYKKQPMLSGDAARYAVMGAFAKDTRINRRVPMDKIENPHPRRKH